MPHTKATQKQGQKKPNLPQVQLQMVKKIDRLVFFTFAINANSTDNARTGTHHFVHAKSKPDNVSYIHERNAIICTNPIRNFVNHAHPLLFTT